MKAPAEPGQAEASNSGTTPVAQFNVENISQDSLAEKVVVIVGGANGIGASLVELLCQKDAHIVIGDIDDERGEAMVRKALEYWPAISDPNPAIPDRPPRAAFQHVDVTDYQAVVDLFDRAFADYKRIDHVVVTAGSMVTGDKWFDQSLNLNTVRQAPSTKDLDVNLIGSLYVTRVASVYLRHNRGIGTDRSVLLFSCAAGFKETPGVPIYQVAKHGVQGLMRALRPYFPSPYRHHLRINTICPWMTTRRSSITKNIADRWDKEGLPVSTHQDVARVSASVLADKNLNGTSMYVEGGRAWEFEANINRLEPQWLGEEPSKTLAAGQKVLRDAWV